MRIIFMGTPDFSVPSLKSLIQSGHEVIAVYTQPPRAKDRGHHIQKSPIHECAESHHINVFTPLNFKLKEEQDLFISHKADIAVVAAYGLVLPEVILKAPRLGCINIHASLLPRWRGAAPIQRALMAGDEFTGITLMQMDKGLDTGAMLAKEETIITPEDTALTLHDRLSTLGAHLLTKNLDKLLNNEIIPIPQPNEGVTYAHKLEKKEGLLDFNLTADELDRRIRAFYPWPSTWFEWNGMAIKLIKATPLSSSFHLKPGTFFKNESHGLNVACHEGSLQIQILQKPGGKPLSFDAFLRGFPEFSKEIREI